ncbi:MAG: Rap1a/Tai family immunity protein [Kiloniellales bacterium]|nr:Rap1a/Tai family immunity protein [Kiloniellales bacterium]
MFSRYSVVILALAFLVPSSTAAQMITDGQSLKKRCDTVQIFMPTSGVGCRGYIGAIIDVMIDENAIYGYRACPPQSKKREDLILAIRSWMEKHPKSLELKAANAAAQALAETFPCTTQ